MNKSILAASIIMVALATAAPARAGGIFIDASALSTKEASTLKSQVAQARASDPDAFRQVKDLVARASELDAKARGKRAPIALYLKDLGAKAVLPMLELIALDTPADLPPAAVTAARLHLVEAVGLLRDTRAMPVLSALLDRDADFHTSRTTAEAMARMETPEAAARLVAALTNARGDHARGILAGMGSCHRASVAGALADHAKAASDDPTAVAITKGLSDVGNSWAWPTLPAETRTEEAASRETASKALVGIYVQHTGDLREAAAKALLVVDDSHAMDQLSAARAGASAETLTALDALATRLANNPLHAKH